MNMRSKLTGKRLCALLLCAAMLLPIIPLPAQATTVVRPAVPIKNATTAMNELPGYSTNSGTISGILSYDCGNGVTEDGAKSTMKIVTGTSANEFTSFCNALSSAGYVLANGWTGIKTIAGVGGQNNLFCKYAAEDGSYSVYTYFLETYGETRIIVDTNRD